MWPPQTLEKDAEMTNLGRISEQEDRKQLWGGEVGIVLYNKVKLSSVYVRAVLAHI